MSTLPPGITEADRLSYPQLSPREVVILKAWLKDHEREYDAFDYNVHVGAGLDPGPTYTDAERAQVKYNSQKRIDAVARKGNQATIIEVKDRAGTTALGELLTYVYLYRREHREQPLPLLLLVSNVLQPDMADALLYYGVDVQLVNA